jgi:hypothetical protein
MAADSVNVVYLAFGNYPYAEIPDGRLAETAAAHLHRVLGMFHDHPSAKITLALTGQTKERVHRDMPDVLDLIRGLIALGRLEMAGCCYAHPNPALVPLASLRRHIEFDLRLTADIFGVQPRLFWSPESTWTPDIGSLLLDLGLNAIYLRQLSDYPRPVRLAASEGTLSAFGDDTRFGLGEHSLIEPHRLRTHMETVVSAGDDEGTLFWPAFCGDLEIAGSGDHLSTFGTLLDLIEADPRLNSVTVSEHLAAHPPTEEVRLDGLSNWVGHQRWWAGCALDTDQNSRIEAVRRSLSAAELLGTDEPETEPGWRLRVTQQLMSAECTENRGWRPGTDRRLWGRAHAIRGLGLARELLRRRLDAAEIPRCPEAEAAPWHIIVPLIESAELPRVREVVRIPVSLPRSLLPDGISVRVDGKPVPCQAITGSVDFAPRHLPGMGPEDPDDVDSITEICFEAAVPPGSLSFAHVYPSADAPPEPSGASFLATADAQQGGAVVEATLDGQELLRGGLLGGCSFTPTRTLQRCSDFQLEASLVSEDDRGGLARVWSASQLLRAGGVEILKTQQVATLAGGVIHVLTALSFRRPEELGTRPVEVAEAVDHDLVVGDIMLPAESGEWTATLPASRGAVIGGSASASSGTQYPTIGEGWIDLRADGRGVALVGDPVVSKLDVARVTAGEGWVQAGLRIGSARLRGPGRADERPGAWSEDLLTSVYFMPHAGDDVSEVRTQARRLTHPLYCPDYALGVRIGRGPLRFVMPPRS